MEHIIHLDSVDAYNRHYGLPTLHPLATVVTRKNLSQPSSRTKYLYGLYALFLKDGNACTLRYGRQHYDYQDGTIVCFAPGQVVEVERVPGATVSELHALLFHPDLIHGTPLGRKMGQYTFFDYAQNEALHLSQAERNVFLDCLKTIEYELQYPVDRHSRQLLTVQVELVLDYCLRFYDRQFCTREVANSDILSRFEAALNEYFESGEQRRLGLPTVKYFADKCCLSPGYFGDLIKKETGRTAQDHIQQKVIHLSKSRLLGSSDTVSEVAYDLGFQYPQHFIRLFKREVGRTPGEYRLGS